MRLSLLLLQLGEFLSAEVAGKWFAARPVSTIASVYAGMNPKHIRRLRVQKFDFIITTFDGAHCRSSRRRLVGSGTGRVADAGVTSRLRSDA